MRDKDSLECDCGEIIIKWNGAVMYTAILVKSPDEKKTFKHGDETMDNRVGRS